METRRRQYLLLTIPALLLMICFIGVPLINGIRISFFKWNGYSKNMKFIGLDNYVKAFKDKYFFGTVRNTLIYGFGSTITNFTYAVKAKNSQVGNTSKIGCALIPYAGDGAVISGLTVEGSVTMTGLTKSTLDMITHINLYAAGIVGTAEGDVFVEDCHAKLTVEPKKDTALKSDAYIYDIALGDVVAYGKVKAEGCTAEIDGSALKGNIKISENKLSD